VNWPFFAQMRSGIYLQRRLRGQQSLTVLINAIGGANFL
jgi:hypothetical protein